MDLVVAIIFFLPQVAISIYLITQTSSEGIPSAARSSRMAAIAFGFLPCLVVSLVAQLYFYSRYRNGLSQVQVASLPTNFRPSGPTSTPTPSIGDAPSPRRQPPPHQNDNPFL